MNREEIVESLQICRDEYKYFKKRYNEEKDQGVKDGLWFALMIASAGVEEYEAQLKENKE